MLAGMGRVGKVGSPFPSRASTAGGAGIAFRQGRALTSSTLATVNPTFSSTPLVGSLLALGVISGGYLNATPTGWTASPNLTIEGGSGANLGHALYWRIADGTANDAPQYVMAGAFNSVWALGEWTGLAASPFNIGAQAFTNAPGGNTAALSQAATPSGVKQVLSLTLLGADGRVGDDMSGAWPSILAGFTEVGHAGFNTTGGGAGIECCAIDLLYNIQTAAGAAITGGATTPASTTGGLTFTATITGIFNGP